MSTQGYGEIPLMIGSSPTQTIVTYTVGKPDPLGGMVQIAQYFKVSFEELKRANPQMSKAGWKLWGGEVLIIPVKPGQPIPPPPKPLKPGTQQGGSPIRVSQATPAAFGRATEPLFDSLDFELARAAIGSIPQNIVLKDIEFQWYLNSIDYYLAFHPDVPWFSIDPGDLAAAYVAIMETHVPYASLFLEQVESVLSEYYLEKVLPRKQLMALDRALNIPTMSMYGMMEHSSNFRQRLREALAAPAPSRMTAFLHPSAHYDPAPGIREARPLSAEEAERDTVIQWVDIGGGHYVPSENVMMIQQMTHAGPLGVLGATISMLNGGNAEDVLQVLSAAEVTDGMFVATAPVLQSTLRRGVVVPSGSMRGRRRRYPNGRPRQRATVRATRPFAPPTPRAPVPRPQLPTMPGTQRSWRNAEGETVIVSVMAPKRRRARFENLMLRSSEKSLFGWHRAHSQGAWFGVESPDGILYAPPNVNLKLQGRVERRIVELFERYNAHGYNIRVTTVTRAHAGTDRLRYVLYRFETISSAGEIENQLEVYIGVPNSTGEDPPGVVRMAPRGMWDAQDAIDH